MIRSVVMIDLKAGHDPAELADVQAMFRRLTPPGILSYAIEPDLGLRQGNWSFAIIADCTDADAYRSYDRDEAHDVARTRLAPLVERIARVQFEVPDP